MYVLDNLLHLLFDFVLGCCQWDHADDMLSPADLVDILLVRQDKPSRCNRLCKTVLSRCSF